MRKGSRVWALARFACEQDRGGEHEDELEEGGGQVRCADGFWMPGFGSDGEPDGSGQRPECDDGCVSRCSDDEQCSVRSVDDENCPGGLRRGCDKEERTIDECFVEVFRGDRGVDRGAREGEG